MPHTRIVWESALSVQHHITIQEMSAVRLPSCIENCQIFYLGLRKHFQYVATHSDSITKLRRIFETSNTQDGTLYQKNTKSKEKRKRSSDFVAT